MSTQNYREARSMTKKNILILSIAVTALLAMSAMAYAGPGYGRGGCGGSGMNNELYSQLTPEKQDQVNKIFEKYHTKQLVLRDKMEANEIKLEAIANSGKVDEDRIDELVTEKSKLRTQMWENRQAMAKEIEAETGLRFTGCAGRGSGYYFGNGGDMGSGMGYGRHGRGHGMGPGHGMGRW